MVAQEDPTLENLDVYDTKAGWWNPDVGDLVVPDGWEFLASGDAFVTRRVKAAGVYWNAWRPKDRRGGHRRRLGVLAPTAAIDAARESANETADQRAKSRAAGARHRERLEADYQTELRNTLLRWVRLCARTPLSSTIKIFGMVVLLLPCGAELVHHQITSMPYCETWLSSVTIAMPP